MIGVQIESKELGSTLQKERIDYLDDCNKKFKKKNKITQSTKREIVKEILIYGVREFISICVELGVEDDCVVMSYFYLQGLRDHLRTDDTLADKWKTEGELQKDIKALLLTLSQYSNRRISQLKREILKKSRAYFPDISCPFSVSVFLNKIIGKKKLF